MIDIVINHKEMKVEVIRNNKVLKTEELDKDSFREYMTELAGDDINMLRKATKLFKPSSYEFKGVEL